MIDCAIYKNAVTASGGTTSLLKRRVDTFITDYKDAPQHPDEIEEYIRKLSLSSWQLLSVLEDNKDVTDVPDNMKLKDILNFVKQHKDKTRAKPFA